MSFYIIFGLIACVAIALILVSACRVSGDAERQAEKIVAFNRAFKQK